MDTLLDEELLSFSVLSNGVLLLLDRFLTFPARVRRVWVVVLYIRTQGRNRAWEGIPLS